MTERRAPKEESETRGVRVRLVWRWKESGTQGAGPWSHRAEVMEVLADALNQRFRERMDHWVEPEPDLRV